MGGAEACIPEVHKTPVGIQALPWGQQHPKGGKKIRHQDNRHPLGGKNVGPALSGPGYIDIT